jgi:hypothetical protein
MTNPLNFLAKIFGLKGDELDLSVLLLLEH